METLLWIIWWIIKALIIVIWWGLPFIIIYYHKDDKKASPRYFFDKPEMIYFIIGILIIHILFWLIWFRSLDIETINIFGSLIATGILAWDVKNCHKLIEQFGDKYGLAIFQNTYMIGMTTEMLIIVMGEADYIDKKNSVEEWYYGEYAPSFRKKITIEEGEIINIESCGPYWLGMPKYLLMASMGYAFETKKATTTKDGTIARYYFHGEWTTHGNRKYQLEITVENNEVIKIKDL